MPWSCSCCMGLPVCASLSAPSANARREFRVEGANAFLAVLIPMAVLVLVLPNYLISAPGPFYSPLQLAFVSAACLGLYVAFLFIQTNWHRAFFLPVGEDGAAEHARPKRAG